MNTLVKSQAKLVGFKSLIDKPKVQLNNPKTGLDNKFYQNLFLIFLGLSIFLIFPESPKDSEKLCNKYNSAEICYVW